VQYIKTLLKKVSKIYKSSQKTFEKSVQSMSDYDERLKWLFPKLPEYLYKKIKIDEPSFHYISPVHYTRQIMQILREHIQEVGMQPNMIPNMATNMMTITDATAGVGGDTLAFAKAFKHVNSIEYDALRAEYLSSNVKLYRFNNVTVYNASCLDVLPKLQEQNIIFLDPPWEPTGESYKENKTLRLPVGNLSLEDLCLRLMDDKYMAKVPELIVLKLPTNYDINFLNSKLNHKKIYVHFLKKMLIVVILVD
jgi:16S rRNA G966 N2-methylase RsmD